MLFVFDEDGLPVGGGIADDHHNRLPAGIDGVVFHALRDP